MRDVVERPGLVVNPPQLRFEVDADPGNQRLREMALRLVQDGVRAVEHLAEKVEFLAQDVERETLRLVLARQKAHDRDATPLPVAVNAPDALLDALWVPRQVVVDQGVAKLEVQALGPGL